MMMMIEVRKHPGRGVPRQDHLGFRSAAVAL
jgi:hypothetical protein